MKNFPVGWRDLVHKIWLGKAGALPDFFFLLADLEKRTTPTLVLVKLFLSGLMNVFRRIRRLLNASFIPNSAKIQCAVEMANFTKKRCQN